MARIGVDVGGTNTDLILETTERDSIGRRIFSHKVPTTLEDQSIAVMRGSTNFRQTDVVERISGRSGRKSIQSVRSTHSARAA